MSLVVAKIGPCTWFALVVALAVTGCRKAEATSAQQDMPAAAPAAMADAKAAAPDGLSGTSANSPAPQAAQRALRITVDTSVVVANLDVATRAVRAMTASAGGYVGEARTDGHTSSFELHVPAAKLAELRGAVVQLGAVASDQEKAEDVTEQRADIDARLHNARAQEQRLLGLLAEKTGSLADVVAVEKELASVRETIERMDAQQRVLEGQIAFATVHLTVSTKAIAIAAPGSGERVAEAIRDGFANAGGFLVGLAVFLASAGPTMLIIGAIGYGIFRVVRALVRRRRAAQAA